MKTLILESKGCRFLGVIVMVSLCAGVSLALQFTSSYLGNGVFSVSYQSPEGIAPIGVALKISLPGGLQFNPTQDAFSCNAYYNVFPDYLFENPMSYLGEGHPFASTWRPGAIESSSSNFSISMSAYMFYTAYDDQGNPRGDLSIFDLDKNGLVDPMDVSLVAMCWLSMAEKYPLDTDFNHDNVVNMIDMAMMNGQQYLLPSRSGELCRFTVSSYDPTKNYAAPVVQLDSFRGGYFVPEPATISLLILGGFALRRKSR